LYNHQERASWNAHEKCHCDAHCLWPCSPHCAGHIALCVLEVVRPSTTLQPGPVTTWHLCVLPHKKEPRTTDLCQIMMLRLWWHSGSGSNPLLSVCMSTFISVYCFIQNNSEWISYEQASDWSLTIISSLLLLIYIQYCDNIMLQTICLVVIQWECSISGVGKAFLQCNNICHIQVSNTLSIVLQKLHFFVFIQSVSEIYTTWGTCFLHKTARTAYVKWGPLMLCYWGVTCKITWHKPIWFLFMGPF
jgi:hypothetical protein